MYIASAQTYIQEIKHIVTSHSIYLLIHKTQNHLIYDVERDIHNEIELC